jgi:hypothetical protein
MIYDYPLSRHDYRQECVNNGVYLVRKVWRALVSYRRPGKQRLTGNRQPPTVSRSNGKERRPIPPRTTYITSGLFNPLSLSTIDCRR